MPESSYNDIWDEEELREHDEVDNAPRRGLSFVTVVGVLIAATLVVLSLLVRSELSETSDRVAVMQERMVQLQEEERRLLIEYEYSLNLVEVERYAREELGMSEPAESQVLYIESGARDSSEVVEPEDVEGDGIFAMFASFVEYFGE